MAAWSLQLAAALPGGGMDFEKLTVWRRARQLSADIYRQLSGMRDFGFRDQITRSGLSVPSNIAEGMERSSDKEKIQFLNIAKASCGELRTQIYIGIDIDYIQASVGDRWLKETREISSMLTGLMKSIKESGKPPVASCKTKIRI
jgi:four helix bundle protein